MRVQGDRPCGLDTNLRAGGYYGGSSNLFGTRECWLGFTISTLLSWVTKLWLFSMSFIRRSTIESNSLCVHFSEERILSSESTPKNLTGCGLPNNIWVYLSSASHNFLISLTCGSLTVSLGKVSEPIFQPLSQISCGFAVFPLTSISSCAICWLRLEIRSSLG